MTPRERRRRFWTALALGLAWSCNGPAAGGCIACDGRTYDFPHDDPTRTDATVLENVGAVHITQALLDFLQPRTKVLLREGLVRAGAARAGIRVDGDDVLHIPLPNTELFNIGGLAEVRLREGSVYLWVDDFVEKLRLRFDAPGRIRVDFRNVRVGLEAKAKQDLANATSACPIHSVLGPDGPGPLRHAGTISGEAYIALRVADTAQRNIVATTEVQRFELTDIDLGAAPASEYCQEPECRDCALSQGGRCLDPGGPCGECLTFCGLVTEGLFSLTEALHDYAAPLINRRIEPIVRDAVRSLAEPLSEIVAQAEGALRLVELAETGVLRDVQPIGGLLAAEPGAPPLRGASAARGPLLSLAGGVEAPQSPCVPDIAPFRAAESPVPIPTGRDQMGRPYHFGVTVGQDYVHQLLHAVHRGGALCFRLTPEDVFTLSRGGVRLTADTLALGFPQLRAFTSKNAPFVIDLRPTQPARVEFGTGRLLRADDPESTDWLIKLSLPRYIASIYGLVQERYVRVLEVEMDIFAGLGLEILPEDQLQLVLGDLEVTNFTPTFDELLQEADIPYEIILRGLVAVLLDSLLRETTILDLNVVDTVSDALGDFPLSLRINEIRRAGAKRDHLHLNATFVEARGPLRVAETEASVDDRDALGLAVPADDTLEYQVRVDGGLWWAFARPGADQRILLRDPKIQQPGRHRIEVRARRRGEPESLDPTPALLSYDVTDIRAVATDRHASSAVAPPPPPHDGVPPEAIDETDAAALGGCRHQATGPARRTAADWMLIAGVLMVTLSLARLRRQRQVRDRANSVVPLR